jgi:hypothetical protein
MLGRQERDEIRQLVYSELAHIEAEVAQHAGTYNYLCWVMGGPVFTHRPVGPVLRTIGHLESE